MEAVRSIHIDKEIGSIGVVSFYRAQVTELRRPFIRRFGSSITLLIEFNSIDGFQGQEKEVIILSCVRAGRNSDKVRSVGFVGDAQRMNVAQTRAKKSPWVLGDSGTLERNSLWRMPIRDARALAEVISRRKDSSGATTIVKSGDAKTQDEGSSRSHPKPTAETDLTAEYSQTTAENTTGTSEDSVNKALPVQDAEERLIAAVDEFVIS